MAKDPLVLTRLAAFGNEFSEIDLGILGGERAGSCRSIYTAGLHEAGSLWLDL